MRPARRTSHTRAAVRCHSHGGERGAKSVARPWAVVESCKGCAPWSYCGRRPPRRQACIRARACSCACRIVRDRINVTLDAPKVVASAVWPMRHTLFGMVRIGARRRHKAATHGIGTASPRRPDALRRRDRSLHQGGLPRRTVGVTLRAESHQASMSTRSRHRAKSQNAAGARLNARNAHTTPPHGCMATRHCQLHVSNMQDA